MINDVQKIVISGRMREEVKEYLVQQNLGFEFRVGDYHEIRQEDLDWADVYVAFRPVDGLDMSAVPWVHALGAGVDFYLFRRQWPENTLLTKTPGNFGRKIGEYCLTRALMFKQRIGELTADQKSRRWEPKYADLLEGDRVLVVGTGNVGAGIGKIFHAMGCHIDGVSQDEHAESFEHIYPPEQLADRVPHADWIILSVPLTEQTYMMFDRAVMSRCTGARLINVSRGPVVQQDALIEALDNHWLSGAALDVFIEEPLTKDSPLWDRKNVIISPHVAAITSTQEAGSAFLQCLNQLKNNQIPDLAINLKRGF
ncbi:MAG: D-2-hydroxyacid dehydrogenase [Planctomycetes bacterium]|nr:D-2-hydroxyacid dehydrogenase [Planctomycetota bacterium]